jgi:hypothetical protein
MARAPVGGLDEKGAAVKSLFAWILLLTLLIPLHASAHLGSPDVFFDGTAGPYPVSVTIRMPGVVPGQAGILVAVHSADAVDVSVTPISSQTAISNTPPAEVARAVDGETNLFEGQLWLMTRGAYGINVSVRGPAGEGSVRIPVNSLPVRQLPMPVWLGGVLIGLGLLLAAGGVAIVAAAAGESVLPPGTLPDTKSRRRYWTAAAVTLVVLAVGLAGGRLWWKSDEAEFRNGLVEGGWPDLEASVQERNSQGILHLVLGKKDWPNSKELLLAPDHGKLLHTYLVRRPGHDVFAHLHPVRAGGKSFDVPLPPLPEGDYEVLCDLTGAMFGTSYTATNTVHIPNISNAPRDAVVMKPDPDDSWAPATIVAAQDSAGSDTACRLPDGIKVIWKAHPCLRARQNAGLQFEVRDDAGRPATLEPYMGMMSHVAVLRSDEQVFAHLHPSGNYSMAAQAFFDAKIGKETLGAAKSQEKSAEVFCGPGGSAIGTGNAGLSIIGIPYEFPSPGNYRLWVQIKSGGQVRTAVFDTIVL